MAKPFSGVFAVAAAVVVVFVDDDVVALTRRNDGCTQVDVDSDVDLCDLVHVSGIRLDNVLFSFCDDNQKLNFHFRVSLSDMSLVRQDRKRFRFMLLMSKRSFSFWRWTMAQLTKTFPFNTRGPRFESIRRLFLKIN